MTFKDLKKRVSLEVSQEQSRLFDRLQGKPFWIWDKKSSISKRTLKTNGDCCFHIIGLIVVTI
ncbi:MAG: hypothetical protein ACJ71I_09665 [Nitrososphaeraceae archaeon]